MDGVWWRWMEGMQGGLSLSCDGKGRDVLSMGCCYQYITRKRTDAPNACPRPSSKLVLSHISHFHAAVRSASLASAPARVR